jgi:hypothetical protein
MIMLYGEQESNIGGMDGIFVAINQTKMHPAGNPPQVAHNYKTCCTHYNPYYGGC